MKPSTALQAHSEHRRLALWRLLERPNPTEAEATSNRSKLGALSGAVRAANLEPATLLAFIMALVQAWPNAAPVLARDAPAPEKQRDAVVEAVRRLTSGSGA